MSGPFGLTAEGFVPKTMDDVSTSLATRFKTAFGAQFKSDIAQAVAGQVVGILAEPIAELWELGEALYHVPDPEGNQGPALDEVCLLTGTVRQTPSSSKVDRVYLVSAGPTPLVPAGSVISVSGAGDRFDLDNDTQIFGRSAWVALTSYTVDSSVVTNDSGKLYACIQSGVSAASGGPTGTGSSIADGSCVWSYIGTGASASGPATATAEDAGPIPAAAGTLTVIETPVGGWSSVTNLNDAVLGKLEENDADLRVRRLAELEPAAGGTADGLRTALLRVGGVVQVAVYHNDTETTDADGTAPHTARCVVLGGSDHDVAAAIYSVIGCGINTQGGTLVNFTDPEGTTIPISFERPTTTAIYIDITLTYDAAGAVGPPYPSDGDDEIKTALQEYGAAFPIGKDVVASALGARGFTVAGVLDVSLVKIGTAPSPGSSTTIVIDKFHIATFDTAHIVVHSSAGTP
jgi:uncharacterized phage protein gp47/JayE